MNILITGGTGLIGRHFINRYCHQHQFTVLTRQIGLYNQHYENNIQYLDDLSCYTDLNSFDAVINLAGEPIANKRWSDTQKQRICQSRWQITKQIVDLLQRSTRPPEVLISGSAIGVYGRQNETPIDESFTNYYQEFTHKICEQWEQIALEAQGLTRVCLLRTGIVLDKHGGALKKLLPSFYLGCGSSIASGQQYMSWIHIDDMTAAIEFILTNSQCDGVFNLTAPAPQTNQEFSQTLASVINRKCWFNMPEAILKLLLGEMADLLIYGQNVMPNKLIKQGFQFSFPELKAALENLLNE